MPIAVRRVRQERDVQPLRPLALAKGAAAAPLVRRSAGGLGLGDRRPPVGRVARESRTQNQIPSVSRIVLRGASLRCTHILD